MGLLTANCSLLGNPVTIAKYAFLTVRCLNRHVIASAQECHECASQKDTAGLPTKSMGIAVVAEAHSSSCA